MKPSAVSAFCAAVLLSAAVRPAVAGYAAGLGQPPLYAEGFKHFGYVNPNAPKGGSFTLPVQGSFDTLNPFTLKGSAESGVAMLTVDTLMTEGGDDPFAMYGLLAQPTTIPTARSTTLPRMMKSLNSCLIDMILSFRDVAVYQ